VSHPRSLDSWTLLDKPLPSSFLCIVKRCNLNKKLISISIELSDWWVAYFRLESLLTMLQSTAPTIRQVGRHGGCHGGHSAFYLPISLSRGIERDLQCFLGRIKCNAATSLWYCPRTEPGDWACVSALHHEWLTSWRLTQHKARREFTWGLVNSVKDSWLYRRSFKIVVKRDCRISGWSEYVFSFIVKCPIAFQKGTLPEKKNLLQPWVHSDKQ
jgi:hypothetical protein